MNIIDEGFAIDADTVPGPRRAHFFSSICRLDSGTILVPCRRGSTKMSPNGNCVIVESTDSGRTWRAIFEDFESRVDGIEGEIRAAELTELDDGTLVAFISWLDRTDTPPDGIRNADTLELAPAKLLKTESNDGGRSWSGYQQLDTGALCACVPAGAPLRFPGKGWLLTIDASNAPGERERHVAAGLFSRDGRSYDRIAEIATHPERRYFYWDQRQAVCPRTGRAVALFWTYDRETETDVPLHLAWGDPDTLTWSEPVSTGIDSQIAAPIPLRDGRLLAFYVHRHPPGSMRLIVSSDEGLTWDQDGEISLYETPAREAGMDGADYDDYWDSMAVWSFGHPAGVELEDNEVLLIYYAGSDSTHLSIRWACVKV